MRPIMVTRGCPYGRCSFCAEPNRGAFLLRDEFGWIRELADLRPGAAVYLQDSILPAGAAVVGGLLPLQSFDSGLRLNVHFYVLWLDGVYGWEPGRGAPVFAEQREVIDADVQQLVSRVRARVLRALRKAGKWVDAGEAGDGVDADGGELLPGLVAAAVQGRAALGERAGQIDGRVGRDGRYEPFVKGPLCAEVEGFSLHAGAWVAARDREGLEKLCRYAARPAVAESRLREMPDGRIAYSMKKRRRDGTTHVVMTKAVLMERLCALVPKPRKHLVTYHGVLAPAAAPAAGLRSQVVPKRVEEQDGAGGCDHAARGDASAVTEAPASAAANAGDAAFRRRQLQRRLRERLRVPHGDGKRRGNDRLDEGARRRQTDGTGSGWSGTAACSSCPPPQTPQRTSVESLVVMRP